MRHRHIDAEDILEWVRVICFSVVGVSFTVLFTVVLLLGIKEGIQKLFLSCL